MEGKANAVSDQTKHALAVALKALMAQKPIDRITIHDLTERAGIRRQNFYYQIEIEENRAVCLCALNSVGRDHLKRFFEADIDAIIHRTVEQLGQEVGAVQAGVGEADIALMTHIYVVLCAGVIESWLLSEIDRTPEELIEFADQMLQDHINGARLRWQAETNQSGQF